MPEYPNDLLGRALQPFGLAIVMAKGELGHELTLVLEGEPVRRVQRFVMTVDVRGRMPLMRGRVIVRRKDDDEIQLRQLLQLRRVPWLEIELLAWDQPYPPPTPPGAENGPETAPPRT